ncbi:TPA: hypothetical protein ACH7LE_004632 [Escherichia coli]
MLTADGLIDTGACPFNHTIFRRQYADRSGQHVRVAEGHLFRVAFAIFFQLSQAAEFQDVPLFPGVFFLPGNKKRVRRGVNVDISGTHPAFSSLWFSAPIIF